MIYSCCNENRRAAILDNPALNAVDYLELLDDPNLHGTKPQRTLLITCLKPVNTTGMPGGKLTPDNILITGGESITNVTALWVGTAANSPAEPALAAYLKNLPNAANIIVVRTSVAGDFSPYTLSLVNSVSSATADPFAVTEVLNGFDPQLAEVSFSFKIDCPPFFDCAPAPPACPPDTPPPPPINYLAKDYGSFRTIMLDRMNQLLPGWGAASEADFGVVLAELIAYAGDQLSYQQDAVATEAYLLTARSRISLRRHALLVDYRVHDGANARAWVCLTVGLPVFLDHSVTRFYTYAPGMPSPILANEQAALDKGVGVFEPMQDANLFPELNTLTFYTWGDLNCCLPQGATEATLAGSFPNLQPGAVLIFQEVLGPETGNPADADLRHRYAVRLTSVTTVDGQGQPLVDPLFEASTGAPIRNASQHPQAVTEIRWSTDDALPAPLCLSSTFLVAGEERTLTNVSIVYGNVVLADHGLTMPPTPLPAVPEPSLFKPPSLAADRCNPTAPVPLPVRYRPQLQDSPVTQAVPLPLAGSPATSTPVPLVANRMVSLPDSNGYTALMVGANNPSTWPQWFGVYATVTAGTFTLDVVFSPSGSAASQVTLESYPNLATPTDAVTQINAHSRLIIASAPGATAPSAVSPQPKMLSNTASVNLVDTNSNTPYLTVQSTNTTTWPPLFSVLAQGDLQNPTQFNLLLLYNSPFGPVGKVTLPVIVQQFSNISLASVEAAFAASPALLSVLTFDQQPNPSLSAHALMNYDPAAAVPSITLTGLLKGNQTRWTAAPDLLSDGPADTTFVVEIETNGTATLRFGDDTNGMTPAATTAFTANLRIGNGTAGNLGAESLIYLDADARILSCTNPLPASGGIDPETPAQIQRRAPAAFLTQERDITMADYVHTTEANPLISSAAATLRWTGSWYTVFDTAEPANGGSLSKALRKSLTQYVNRYRLAGQDLKLEGPDYVSLAIALTVCVDPAYFRSDVQEALMQVLGAGAQPNGKPGVFAPGNFQLGQSVYLSPIYTAARSVAGVTTVVATTFQPQALPPTPTYIQQGEIPMGPFQVARLANDRSLPASGQLTLNMQGGK